tara:strand:- start:1169 stop:4960 length:3792 start_codon:yes stop_codon:yes gene_type:complete
VAEQEITNIGPSFDFSEDVAPAIRQFGLSNAVKGLMDVEEGSGIYEDLRNNAGLNDLEIMQRHLNLPKIDFPIQSMRTEGLSQEEIQDVFLGDLGIDLKKDLMNAGIAPEDFLKAFVKHRELTTGEALAEGVGRGFTVGAPATAGMVIGASAGAPVFPPFGSFIGGGIGLILGAVGGTEIEEEIFDQTPLLDNKTIGLLEGSKVITEGLLGMGAPRAFTKVGEAALSNQTGFLNKLGDSIRLRSFNQKLNPVFQPGAMPESAKYLAVENPVMFKFLDFYRKNPGLFQTAEGFGVAGAGLGAGIAETIAPGDPLYRIGYEVGGGMALSSLNVTKYLPYLLTAVDGIRKDASTLVEGAGEKAQEQRVGQALREFLVQRGEDPAELVRLLRNPEFNELLQDAKKDYEGVRPLLEAANLPAPNSRALTNSATLELIEGRLRSLNGRFGADVQNNLDAQSQQINDIISTLRLTAIDPNDPSAGNIAIQTAADLRKTRFEELIQDRLEHAMAQAQLATKKLQGFDSPAQAAAAQRETSAKIDNIIKVAFKDVRDQENQLYKAVPDKILVGQENFVEAIGQELDRMTPEVADRVFDKAAKATEAKYARAVQAAALDSRIEYLSGFDPTMYSADAQKLTGLKANQLTPTIEKLKKDRADLGEDVELEQPTLQQMKNYRSYLLNQSQAAKSGKNPDMGDWSVYASLANGIKNDMDDLETIQKLNQGTVTGDDLEALDKARAYGKAMRDVFRRAFPNEVLTEKSSGQEFIEPELLYETILRGSDNATTIKMEQVNDAVRFLVDPNVPGTLAGDPLAETIAEGRIDNLQTAYDLVTRQLINNPSFIDATTDEAKNRAIDAYMVNNAATLDLLPNLKTDLENASTRQTLLLQARDKAKSESVNARFYRGRFFQQLTGERPVRALETILSSERPSENFTKLVDRLRGTARRIEQNGLTEKEQQAGFRPITVNEVESELRDSVFEAAYRFATRDKDSVSGMPDFQQMNTFFFKERGKQKPLISLLVDNGILNNAERTRLKKLLVAGEGAQRKVASPGFDVIEDLESGTDVLTNLIVRTGGAGGGSLIGKLLPGDSTLIAASAGSKAALKFLDAIPTTTTNKILQDAINDPEYLALLLDKDIITAGQEKPLSFLQKMMKLKRLNIYVKNALGITSGQILAQEELSPEEEKRLQGVRLSPFPRAPMTDADAMRKIYENSRPSFQDIPPPEDPAAPPPQAQAAPPNPQLRQRYAAMYPNDPISGLIEQQAMQTGIGTLKG